MTNIKNSKGFTLIELAVVMAILAIIAAIAIPSYTGYIDKSKEKLCLVQRDDLRKFFQAQKAADDGFYATTAAAEKGFAEAVYNAYQIKMSNDKIEGLCPSGGRYTVVFDTANYYVIQCSIHDSELESLDKAIEYTEKALESMFASGINYPDGKDLIKEYYKLLDGNLPVVNSYKVEEAFTSKGITVPALYWKPSKIMVTRVVDGKNVTTTEFVMFATNNDDNSHSIWQAYIAYYQGEYYVCNIENGVPKPGTVAFGNSNNGDKAVLDKLKVNGFKPLDSDWPTEPEAPQ